MFGNNNKETPQVSTTYSIDDFDTTKFATEFRDMINKSPNRDLNDMYNNAVLPDLVTGGAKEMTSGQILLNAPENILTAGVSGLLELGVDKDSPSLGDKAQIWLANKYKEGLTNEAIAGDANKAHYLRNQDAYRTAFDIGTLFAGGAGVAKGTTSAMRRLSKTDTAIGKLIHTADHTKRLRAKYRQELARETAVTGSNAASKQAKLKSLEKQVRNSDIKAMSPVLLAEGVAASTYLNLVNSPLVEGVSAERQVLDIVLGIGLGGLVGHAITRAAMKGDKQIAGARGMEKFVKQQNLDAGIAHHNTGIYQTAELANYMDTMAVQSADGVSEDAVSLFNNQRNAANLELYKQIGRAFEQTIPVQNASTKGFSSAVNIPGKKATTKAQATLVANFSKKHPTVMIGLEALETNAKRSQAFYKNFDRTIEALDKEIMQNTGTARDILNDRRRYVQSLSASTIDDNGKMRMDTNRYNMFHDSQQRIKAKKKLDPKSFNLRTGDKQDGPVELDTEADFYDITRMYHELERDVLLNNSGDVRGGSPLAEKLRKRTNKLNIDISGDDFNYVKGDAILFAARKIRNTMPSFVKGVDSRLTSAQALEQLERKTLAHKLYAFKKLALKDDIDIEIADIAKALNLNLVDDLGEATPVYHMAMEKAGDPFLDSPEAIFDNLGSMDKIRNSERMKDFKGGITGDMLRYSKLKSNNEYAKPVTMYHQDTDQAVGIKQKLKTLADDRQIQAYKRAAAYGADNLGNSATALSTVDTVIKGLSHIMADVKNVAHVIEEVTTGTGGVKALQQRSHRFRHSNTMRAADHYAATLDRVKQRYKQQFMQPLVNAAEALHKKGADVTRYAFNNAAIGLRQGFEIDLNGTTGYTFKLKATPQNEQLFKQLFNIDMPSNAALPDMLHAKKGAYQPLRMDDTSMNAVVVMQDLSKHLGHQSNQMKAWKDMPLTNIKDGHMPIPDMRGQEMVLVTDVDGNVIGYAMGDTLEQAQQAANSVMRSNDKATGTITRTSVADYYEARDRAFLQGNINFNDLFAQDGKKGNKGAIPNVPLTADLFEGMVHSLNRELDALFRRAGMLHFEKELKSAEVLNKLSKSNEPMQGFIGKSHKPKAFTAFDEYQNVIIGIDKQAEGSAFAGVNSFIEEQFGKKLATMADNVAKHVPVKALTGKQSLQAGNAGTEDLMRRIQDVQGYSPAANAAEFVEATTSYKFRPEAKQALSDAGSLVSLVVLGVMDLAHAVTNVASLAVTVPMVGLANRRLAGESMKAYKARRGSFLETADQAPMISPYRTMASTLGSFMWSDEGKLYKKLGQERGYLRADMQENSDIIHGARKNLAERFRSTKVGKFATYMNDKSEGFTREFAYMNAVNMYKDMNVSDEMVAAMASRFADDAVGDYRHANRPPMFQGAMGMPLGLFQTYVTQMYQRMFSMIEDADARGIAVTAAAQASVFGLKSVPGYSQYSQMFAGIESERDPVVFLEKQHGSAVADVLLYGTLSNIPKLMGADDGFSIHTRGDANIRSVPNPLALQNTPLAMIGRNMHNMSKELYKAAKEEGLSFDEALELVSLYGINRPLRGGAEILQGYASDKSGSLINRVDTPEEVIARLMGLKTNSEQTAAVAQFKGQVKIAKANARQSSIDRQLGVKLKNGNLDAKDIERWVNDSLANGRNPETLLRSFRYRIQKNVTTKAERNAQKLLRNYITSNEGQLLMDIVGVSGVN